MSVDFEAIRKQEWPVLEQMVFLDAACVSFAPQRTVRAVKAFADMTATQEEENSSAHHIAMDSLRGKAYDDPAWENVLDCLTVEEMMNMVRLGGWQTAQKSAWR